MKKLSYLFLLMMIFSGIAYAETIKLRSGKIVEGKIIEKTNKYIKLDFYNIPLTFYLDEIESINGEDVVYSQAQESAFSRGNTVVVNEAKEAGVDNVSKVEENTQSTVCTNRRFGISFDIPDTWKPFESTFPAAIVQTLNKGIKENCDFDSDQITFVKFIKPIQGEKVKSGVIVFSVSYLEEDSERAFLEDAKLFIEFMKSEKGADLVGEEEEIFVNQKKFLRFSLNMIQDGKETRLILYLFHKVKEVFMFNLTDSIPPSADNINDLDKIINSVILF